MARPGHHLDVWLGDVRVAELTSNGRPYDLRVRYTADALERWPVNTPVLSCSLPLGRSKQAALPFFRGLLPEGQHLQRLAGEAKIVVTDVFALLERYGRDVAGALTIVAAGGDPTPRPGDVEAYRPGGLERDVADIEDHPLGIRDDSELSLAGVQNKLLLVRTEDGWARPLYGYPSTHILKVEDRRYPGLVRAEADALRLAAAVGLTTITPEVVELDGIDCLIVDRYDRVADAGSETGGVGRVHQEDLAQALGRDVTADRGRAKYEAHGGPSLADIADVLDRHASDPMAELERLAAAVTFNTVIGNADAHVKNYSLLHRSPGEVTLAPLYDTVPTLLWPKLPDRSALRVNGVSMLTKVTRDDLVAEASSWLLGPTRAAAVVDATIAGVAAALDEIEVGDAFAEHLAERLSALQRD